MIDLTEDLFLLDLPIFIPKYDSNKSYIYSSRQGKENLKRILLETSDDYCMYCYSKVLVDNKLSAHLEHSIEKKNSKILKDCNINISITCMKCNLSFKRIGEDKRELYTYEIKEFEDSCKCGVICHEPCKEYENLREIYLNKETAEIILQPFGVINRDTGNEYKIQYNLLEQEFIISESYIYTDKEQEFINRHIIRFNLNDADYRTREVIKVCEDVIDYNYIPKKKRYDNLIADLFIDRLISIEIDKAVRLCEQILIFAQFRYKL